MRALGTRLLLQGEAASREAAHAELSELVAARVHRLEQLQEELQAIEALGRAQDAALQRALNGGVECAD